MPEQRSVSTVNYGKESGTMQPGEISAQLRELMPTVIKLVKNELRLAAGSEGRPGGSELQEVRIREIINHILDDKRYPMDMSQRKYFIEAVKAEVMGYGPLDPLLEDNHVTEIMVNGPFDIYVEKAGRLEYTHVKFNNVSHMMSIIDRIVAPIGRHVDESDPMVDARLPNGYRVNVTLPPLSMRGPVLTIRKFSQRPFTADELVGINTLSRNAIRFLKACIEARMNVVISGGSGSGKTTLLNVLSAYIPDTERIITIEDIAELQLHQHHLVSLEKRPPDLAGNGEVTIRQLVINALRMRPDRIIVGECRGGEALDMLQAMNTGHSGSMTTVHSNSPRDTLHRIEIMTVMSGVDLPLRAIREQVTSAIDLIIHMERLSDGSRRVVKITELQGMEGEVEVLQDIFVFQNEGIKNGKVAGELKATGLRPKFIHRFAQHGVQIPTDMFT